MLWYISNFERFEKTETLIEITPVEKVSGFIKVPGSKSYTNRALLIAALANGVSRLEKPLVSDDTKFMIQALNGFGIQVKEEPNTLIVSGTGGKLTHCVLGKVASVSVLCRCARHRSGASPRPYTALRACIITFDDHSLRSRPKFAGSNCKNIW